jgi:hypothetical protein
LESKKILILAYDFPPYVSVGGLRPYNWYKYLNEFGVYPILVTRQWNNDFGNELDYISASHNDKPISERNDLGKIIRTPYKPNLSNRLLMKYGHERFVVVRKSITAFYELAQFFFPVGPKVQLYKEAKRFLRENKVDAIIATGDPFILFEYASKLSKEFNTPWIADYRDPWSQNKSNKINHGFSFLNKFLEKRALKNVKCISTVDQIFKTKISSLLKNKEFHILPNGFDPEALDKVKHIEQDSEILQIAFVGTIYDWHPIRSFLDVLNRYVLQFPKAKIRFNLYGINIPSEINSMISSDFPSLKNYVSITTKLPNSLLLEELAKNNVMLLFNYYAYTGTKIYDYIGIRRKIIMCYSNDEEAKVLKQKYYNIESNLVVNEQLQERIILDSNSGIVLENATSLFDELIKLQAEFDINGKIECNSVNVENYSRKIQVKKLSEIIKSL